ncbi:MAG: MlaC/ttg2D family ABC transporter substrate-binding protein [Rhodanobacteraceae bacterium]
MLRISSLLLTAMFLLAAFNAPLRAAPPAETPQQIVENMASQISKAIDGHQAELSRHPEKMTEIVDRIVLPHFDIDYAALLVLGQHAFKATPAQRLAFTKAFTDALTSSYAKGLADYAKVHIKVLPSPAAADQRRVLLRTQVLVNGGGTVRVDLAFHKTSAGEWKAYDVIIEGISYITLYRNQVNSEIQKVGIDGLIKRLQTNGVAALTG